MKGFTEIRLETCAVVRNECVAYGFFSPLDSSSLTTMAIADGTTDSRPLNLDFLQKNRNIKPILEYVVLPEHKE